MNFGPIDNDLAVGNASPLLAYNDANQTSPAIFRVDSISTILYLNYLSEKMLCREVISFQESKLLLRSRFILMKRIIENGSGFEKISVIWTRHGKNDFIYCTRTHKAVGKLRKRDSVFSACTKEIPKST